MLIMRIGALNLTQKPFHYFNKTILRIQRTTLFFHQSYPMAEATPINITPAPHPIQPQNNHDSTTKEASPPPPPPPPPPEKPEPGDCCGSGCVRCVWDVYYDELEEYHKLYKQDTNNTNS